MSTLAEIKRQARKTLHAGMSVETVYTPFEGAPLPLPVPLRLHNQRRLEGGMGPSGFTELIVTEDRAVFDADVLLAMGLEPAAGDTFTVTAYAESYRLVDQDLSDGPVNQYWRLSRL